MYMIVLIRRSKLREHESLELVGPDFVFKNNSFFPKFLYCRSMSFINVSIYHIDFLKNKWES